MFTEVLSRFFLSTAVPIFVRQKALIDHWESSVGKYWGCPITVVNVGDCAVSGFSASVAHP
jgi:hypothetical protein